MKKFFYPLVLLIFFFGAFLTVGNAARANYQCSSNGASNGQVYSSQAACNSACVNTASCTASNYWSSCSYWSDGDTCSDPSGNFYVSNKYAPNAWGYDANFDSNCNITSWGNCDGYGGEVTPGSCSNMQHTIAQVCNESTQSVSYSCPLANAYQTSSCALGLSGNTGWMSLGLPWLNDYGFGLVATATDNAGIIGGSGSTWIYPGPLAGYYGYYLPSDNNSLQGFSFGGTYGYININGTVFNAFEDGYDSFWGGTMNILVRVTWGLCQLPLLPLLVLVTRF